MTDKPHCLAASLLVLLLTSGGGIDAETNHLDRFVMTERVATANRTVLRSLYGGQYTAE